MSTNQTGPFAAYGARLAALGYEPLPLAGKRPIHEGWQHYDPQRLPALADTSPNANVGIATRGLAAMDCDVYDKAVAEHMRLFIIKRLKRGSNKILFRVGQAPKWLALFRRETAGPKRRSATYVDSRGRRHVIEWLSDGQQFLAFGPHPETGNEMRWPNGSPLDGPTPPEELYVVTEADIDAINDEFARVAELSGWRLADSAVKGTNTTGETASAVKGVDHEVAAQALAYYDNDELHYDDWLAVGMALHHQFGGDVEAFELWNDWSARADKCGDTRFNWHRWQTFDDTRPGGVSMRSVLMLAEAEGWTRPAGVEAAPAASDEFPAMDELQVNTSGDIRIAPGESARQIEPVADATPQPQPEPQPDETASDPSGPIPTPTLSGVFHIPADFDPSQMPRRAWIVGGVLLRGHVSITIGPPGVAKSVFDLTRAIAIITGRELLGEPINVTGPVLVVNNEDPRDEIERRIVAICNHYTIPISEIADHLHIVSGYESPVKLAELHGDRLTGSSLRPTKEASRLIRHIDEHAIVAVIVDPLISTAKGSEENSNDRMEELVSIYKRIAGRTHAAIAITHHTRKTGSDSEAHAGNMESARGGGALIGAVRMAYTLARMSADTGLTKGLPRSASRRLIRLDDAKQNYWISDDEARWYFLESVNVGNGETAGVPRPVILEEVQREYGDPESVSVEAQSDAAKRGVLVQLFIGDFTNGQWSGPLSRVAERWMASAGISKRAAQDQIKQLLPEGGYDHAVHAEASGVGFWLWREIEGGEMQARHRVLMAKAGCFNSENVDWID